MSKTITVTIGRNVGDQPLPVDRWNEYVFSTAETVRSFANEVYASGPYRGYWDGVSEDAHIWHAAANEDLDETALRARLATLATYYGQDAIALAIGVSELVKSFAALIPEGVTS